MKNLIKKSGYALLNIVLIIGFTILIINKMENENVVEAAEPDIVVESENTVELDIFFMYENKKGGYFLEPKAEFENVIFIDKKEMENMNMDKDIHHGTKFTGVFDSEGWELIGIANEDETKELEIFFMYENEIGGFFLEPSADFENVIYIDKQTMNDWNMGDEIHHGESFIGIFDNEGWELFGIKKVEPLVSIEESNFARK